jgi:glycosyltransferase involved in cell wall biosynthesis
MKLSVFTPTHQPEKLIKAAHSLAEQTHQDYEWVVLVNGNGIEDTPYYDAQVSMITHGKAKVVQFTQDSNYIGLLKKTACEHATGEILVELDHDDTLEPTCLEELNRAFEDPSIDFCYSDWFEWKDGKTFAPFSEKWGWTYTNQPDGRIGVNAFEMNPLSVSYIWFGPNHVRAWRKSFYDKIGGHNPELDVCDDYEIICRTYVNGKCHRIAKPLYNYYIGENTCYGEKNKKIQRLTRSLHDKWIGRIVQKWCDLHNLKKVDLCSCDNKPEGFIGVDCQDFPGIDIVCDLDGPWPFEDNSVGLFRMQDAIEHLKDPIHTMKEIWRCLAPYGWAFIEVPSTDGRGAFQDPTHVSFWNSNSFWYYTRKFQAKFIGTPVMFQENRILNYFPNKFCENNNIPYVKAHLVKLLDDGVIPPKGREI